MALPQGQWKKAAKGIRYREHATRKHGKRPDRYYTLQYKHNGKVYNEAVGWASDGVTQDECEKLLVTLRENWRNGTGPISRAEIQQAAQDKKESEQRKKEEEKARLVTVETYYTEQYLPQAKRVKERISWMKEDSLFKNWINPAVGHLPLAQIEFQNWDNLMSRLDKAKLSQRTKEYVAGTLRRIMRHAQDRGMDIKIPTAKQIGATAPKDNRRLRVLTKKENTDILEYLQEKDIYAWRIVKFAMLTGCRASEAFRLRWTDVDLNAGILKFANTKNKENRTVFLSEGITRLLQSIGPRHTAEPVFPRSDGKPHVDVPFQFKEAVKRLKLNEGRQPRERISFHSIRHSVATQLACQLDIRSLMDVMGWKQVSMAARYIHSDEKNKRAAMNTLDKTLSNEK